CGNWCSCPLPQFGRRALRRKPDVEVKHVGLTPRRSPIYRYGGKHFSFRVQLSGSPFGRPHKPQTPFFSSPANFSFYAWSTPSPRELGKERLFPDRSPSRRFRAPVINQ